MKDTKYRFETLCLYDYRGVEEHLSSMAAQGWRLEKAGNTFWKYCRAEPKKVRYAVTYSATASQFNPRPTEGQRSLAELCEAAGWRKVCDWFQMQIFCTEDPDAVPLETDEALRLENIHRSMRKNFLPSNLLLLAIGLFMSVSFLGTLFLNPLRIFEQNSKFLTGPMVIMVAILGIYTLLHYYGWRRRSRRSVEDGGPCAPVNTRAHQRLNHGGLALVGLLVVLYLLMELFTGGRGMLLFYAVYIFLFLLVVFLVRQSTAFFRHCGASKGGNIAGTLIVDFVLVSVLIGGLSYGAIHFDWFFGSGTGETYRFRDMEWNVEPARNFPLTISDLTGETYEHIYRACRDRGSFFLPERSYWERVVHENGPGRPLPLELYYTVREPRLAWLRDALVEEETAVKSYPHWESRYAAEDPGPWGAEAAYLRYLDGEPSGTWLLVWPGRVVGIYLEDPPTDREKAVIGQCLAPKIQQGRRDGTSLLFCSGIYALKTQLSPLSISRSAIMAMNSELVGLPLVLDTV